MSAGVFQLARYQGDVSTQVFNVRVQPETLSATIATVANASATAASTIPGRLKTSAGRKTAGLRPRRVTLSWTAAPPANYKAGSTVRVLALTPAFFAACTIGATGTYLGAAVQVVGRSTELS
jgi:hypothetical protein